MVMLTRYDYHRMIVNSRNITAKFGDKYTLDLYENSVREN